MNLLPCRDGDCPCGRGPTQLERDSEGKRGIGVVKGNDAPVERVANELESLSGELHDSRWAHGARNLAAAPVGKVVAL